MDDFWMVILVVVAVLLFSAGMIAWGMSLKEKEIAEETCQALGFDGQIQVDGEALCYVACPLGLALSRECLP